MSEPGPFDKIDDFTRPTDERGNRVSGKTISRMRDYLCVLNEYEKQGISVVASHEIAEKLGVKPGLVRKDLSNFGGFGRPSVGYKVAYLQKKIKDILRINIIRSVAWIGAKRLRDETDLSTRLEAGMCRIAAVFDANPQQFPSVAGELEVLELQRINEVVLDQQIELAVLAVPAGSAQAVADILAGSNIKAILNLSPTVLAVPSGITVHNMDIASELMMLSYYCSAGD